MNRKRILLSSRFVPFGTNLAQFEAKSAPGTRATSVPAAGMVGLAPKWVRLDPNLDKSGTFSDQIFSTFGPGFVQF